MLIVGNGQERDVGVVGLGICGEGRGGPMKMSKLKLFDTEFQFVTTFTAANWSYLYTNSHHANNVHLEYNLPMSSGVKGNGWFDDQNHFVWFQPLLVS